MSDLDNQIVEPNVVEKIRCPVCMDIPSSRPIFQCSNGHIICKDCSGRFELITVMSRVKTREPFYWFFLFLKIYWIFSVYFKVSTQNMTLVYYSGPVGWGILRSFLSRLLGQIFRGLGAVVTGVAPCKDSGSGNSLVKVG
jgi:hypothetical protein